MGRNLVPRETKHGDLNFMYRIKTQNMNKTFTHLMHFPRITAVLLALLSVSVYQPIYGQGSGNDYIYFTEGSSVTEYIWRGNRDGTFSICPKQVISPSTFTLGVGNWSGEGSFFVDLNNDGTSDYIRCYEPDNYIDAYLNDGNGNFSHVVSPISNPTGQFGGYDNTEIDGLGDANGDGYMDYMNVNDDVNPNVSIYLNTSSTTPGTFARTPITFNLEVSSGAGYCVSGRTGSSWSYFADLNNDGKIDFISMTGQTIYVWLGSGSGSTFRFGTLNANGRYDPNQTQTVPTGYVWTGEGSDRAAFLADVNGDGILDYVFGQEGTGYGIFFYPGLGNGRFTIPTGTPTRFAYTVPTGLGTANMEGNYGQEGTFLKDVNGDGKVDWVFMKDDAGASSGIYVWLGTGNGAAPFVTTPAVTLTESFTTASGYIDQQIGRLANILTTAYTFNVPLAPGGVGKGLSLWVRADSLGGTMTDGAPVSLWKNKAQNFDVTQSVASNQPTYRINQVNYNPAVVFNGVNDNVNGSWMNFADQQDIRSAFWMTRDLATDLDYDQFLFGDDNTNPSGTTFHSGAGYLQWCPAGLAGTNIWHKDGLTTSCGTYYDYGPTGKPNLVSVVDSTECIKAANFSMQAPYPTRKWNGPICETMLYNRALTPTERQRVESYMAIKYGVSLDQTTGQNYLASDGSIIWNAASNTIYKNNITGIGRDDASGLIQKQSRSVNTTNYANLAYMGLGSIATTNQANTNSFSANRNFLIWSDDGASVIPIATTVTTDGTTTIPTPACGAFKRLGRTWRVSETGTIGPVEVKFALGSSLAMGTSISDFYLAVNSTSTFSGTVTKLYQATTFVGNTVTFDGVNFSDGQYFILIGKKSYAPGNVTAGLKFWLKADDGITFNGVSNTVAQWNDQSATNNYVSQTSAGNQPVFYTSRFNFNPSVSFTGGQMMLMNLTLSNTDFKLFCAGMPYNSGTWNTLFRNTVSKGDHHLIINPSTPYMGYFDQNYGFRNSNMLVSYTAPSIMDMLYTTSTTAAIPRLNGKVGTTLSPITYTAGTDDLYQHFGSLSYGQPFGNVGEVIVYNGALAASDVQKIESYLAVKWGISIDQTTPTNYLASDGSIFWNATTNGTFKYHVTGLGRDDCSDLLQKQSANSDTTGKGNIVIMGLDTIATDNFLNNGLVAADKNFLMWADNNVAISPPVNSAVTGDGTISLTLPCGNYLQLPRTWRIEKTGTFGIVQVKIDLTGVNMGKTVSDFYLAVNTSATMSGTIAKLYAPASYVNNVLTFNNVNFSDGQYFTILGKKVQGPGNITAGLKLWLKADYGVTSSAGTVTQWADQGPQNLNLVNQGWALPGYIAIGQNFNPIVTFNGGQGIGITPGMLGTNSYTGSTVFAMAKPNGMSAEAMFQEALGAGGQLAGYLPYGSQFLWDGPSNERLANTLPTTIVNAPSLWTLYSNTGSQIIYQNDSLRASATVASAAYTGNNSQLGVGVHPGAGYWYGNMSELLVYTQPLTAIQQQIINSYMALKWGVSLKEASSYNYIASDTSIFWSATGNGIFKNHITGIGRDDCSELMQKQSQNADTSNSGNIVAIGSGKIATSNILDSSSILNNKSFLMWADNNAALTPILTSITGDGTTTLSAACGSYKQLGRTWRVQKTGNPVNYVEMQVNLTGVQLGKRATDFYLAVNSSATMSGTITKLYKATSFANNIVTFDSIVFSDGQYFTIVGRRVYGPAGITSNILLWLNGEDGITLNGTTVSEWDDISGNLNNMLQPTTANQPIYNSSSTLINFNPGLTFNGSNSFLSKTAGILGTATYAGASVFAMTRSNAVQNQSAFCEFGTAGQFNMHDPWGDANIYWDAGCGCGNYRLNTAWGGTVGIPYLWTLTYATTPSQSQGIYRNGLALATDATATSFTGNNQPMAVGAYNNGGAYSLNGQIGELIMYGQSLTATQTQQVNSYMALKYGITLDQTTATNYVASDGSVFWNAATNAAYKYRITGIGRDDCSDLIQRISRNQDTTNLAYVTMGLGTIATSNSADTNSIGTDKNFMMWADNNVSALPIASAITGDGTTTFSTSCGSYKQSGRTWRIQKTGTAVGAVQVQINLTGVNLGNSTSDFYLAINSSATFSGTITKLVPAASYTGNVVTFNNVTFTDGQYFTIVGTRVIGPGNVINNLALWLRADTGIVLTGSNVSQWNDLSNSGNNVVQATPASQPIYNTTSNLVNFNPSLSFNGSNSVLAKTGGMLGTGTYNGAALFSVDNPTTLACGRPIFEYTTGGNAVSIVAPWCDNNLYFNYGPSYIAIAAGAVTNITNLYAANSTNTPSNSQVIKLNNKTMISATNATTYTGNNSDLGIGALSNGTNSFNGLIPEVIAYTGGLSTTDLQKVQSYLAIKYGITLDQTTAYNYVASDGTIFWNGISNGAFKYRITGIGRDDCSKLLQKQSRNQDTTSAGYVTMALNSLAASNPANVGTVATDKTFLMWSDNNASPIPVSSAVTTDGTNTLNVSCGQYKQLGKTFRASATGSIGAVQVVVNLTGISKMGRSASDFYLAINSSSTFGSTVTQLVPAATYANNIVTFNNVTFTDGQYFTVIGHKNYGPANVTNGILEWLKADDAVTTIGTNVTEWDDQSGNFGNVTQATTANQPTYNSTSNLINFNPTLSFNGTSSALTKTGGILGTTTYPGAAAFAVAKTNAIQVGGLFYEATSAWQFDAITPWSDGNVYWDGGSASGTARLYTAWGGTLNTPYVWSFNYASTPSQSQTIFRNGLNIASDATAATLTGNNSTFYIGEYGTTAFYNGSIGEVILYGQPVSVGQMQKVNSYLAIKWGVSLDQTTATNYLASDSSVIWNATTNSTYKNRITGIGRDDCSELMQLQSQNQDTTSPGYVTMGVSTIAASNAANSSTFPTDKSFELWGDDGGTGITTSTVTGDGTTTLGTGSCRLFRRMVKIYKVAETGNVGSLQVNVNIKGLSALGKVASDFYLAINTSSTFVGTITQLIQASAYTNGVLTFNNVNFANGEYFTIIGQKAQGPANITNGLKLWLKAEDGITLNGSTVSEWDDQGPFGNNVRQDTTVNQPTYNNASTNLINYNPSLSFNGTTDYMYKIGGMLGASTYTGSEVFLVSQVSAVQISAMFGEATTNSSIDALVPWGDANVYWDAGMITGAGRLSTPWGGVINKPYLWTMTYATSPAQSQAIYRNGKAIASDATAASYTGNNSNLFVGGYIARGSCFNGLMGELLIYSQSLTAIETQQINSYLALKYGSSLDQTTATNYLASDSSLVFWNAATNGAYKYRITGIGRDDCSDLLQQQSRNVDTVAKGNIVYIGLNAVAVNDAANTGTIANDKSFLMWADNNDNGNNIIDEITTGVPAGQVKRIDRVWRVQETGTFGQLEVNFDLNNVTQSGTTATDFTLLVSSNGNFATSTVAEYSATSFSGGIVTIDGVSLSDGQYFTLATKGCNSIPIQLIPTNTTVTAAAECPESNGWTYYYDISNATRLVFAIQHDPLNGGSNNFKATVVLTTTPAANTLDRTNVPTVQGNFLMPRYWNVNIVGSMPNPVNVRFYYDTAELSATIARATAWQTLVGASNISGPLWFKTQGHDFSAADVTTTNVNTRLGLTPIAGTEQGVNYVEFDGVPSFSGGTVAIRVSNTNPELPVVLSYFDVVDEECNAIVKWRTETEINSQEFIIQKTTDGYTWTDTKQVAAAGNSSSAIDYSINDGPVSGLEYFRLKMIDIDGQFKYSPIVSLQTSCSEEIGFITFPNPVNSNLFIQFSSTLSGDATVKVINPLGQQEMSSVVTNISADNTTELDLSGLPDGVYFLTISIAGRATTRTIVKISK